MKKMGGMVFVVIPLLTLTVRAKSDDFTIVKGRVIAELMRSSIDDSEVKAIIDGMNDEINSADGPSRRAERGRWGLVSSCLPEKKNGAGCY